MSTFSVVVFLLVVALSSVGGATAAAAKVGHSLADAARVGVFYYVWQVICVANYMAAAPTHNVTTPPVLCRYGDPSTDGKYKHWDHEILPHWNAKERNKYEHGRWAWGERKTRGKTNRTTASWY